MERRPVLLLALLPLAGCGRSASGIFTAAAACPPGVIAQTPEGNYGFTDGWVRLSLRPCAGAVGAANRLVVDGASSVLAFKPGQARGVTAGVLTATSERALLAEQRFPLPAGSAAAREVVLSPLDSGAPATRLRQVRLVADGG